MWLSHSALQTSSLDLNTHSKHLPSATMLRLFLFLFCKSFLCIPFSVSKCSPPLAENFLPPAFYVGHLPWFKARLQCPLLAKQFPCCLSPWGWPSSQNNAPCLLSANLSLTPTLTVSKQDEETDSDHNVPLLTTLQLQLLPTSPDSPPMFVLFSQ